MPTKLSRYAEGIMEAAWLAAVILVPVFFNIFSSRIFEPDKISLLRTLALVILAAWIIKLIDEGGVHWERLQPGESGWKTILHMPLIVPVISLVVIYIIATIFSVTPRVSLWGSYQRLQGTYTTFSYLVIFAAILANVSKRGQVERLVTTVILSSLPVSLYGILQHYRLDPIPWGGNVSQRIAANMGNSIFVAAYLIMVFPLTVVRIVETLGEILNDRGTLAANFARSTAYVFIVALQVIAIFFSGSRGPWLGWGASLIFMGLLLSLVWHKRWMTASGVSLALIIAAFLLVLNIQNGPLESIRTMPGFGRLGQLLDAESRTGRVRTLIWQGAAELVLPHQPLEYPDGSKDRFNFLRPLIGYGPESMYVAYNPFYQPELAQVESRNASPDRSHNATWDSLVITGVLGLIVYLALFWSVFYYGLKWLGLINSKRQRNLFIALYIGGGVISALIFVLWQGPGYFGVGLPFGVIVGLVVYLILASLFGNYQAPQTHGEMLRAFMLMGLLAAIVAHFVEINFGIPIAATRSHFWVYSGLLFVVGYILPQYNGFGEFSVTNAEPLSREQLSASKRVLKARAGSSKKKRRSGARGSVSSTGGDWPGWLREALVASGISAILIITLGYDFISAAQSGKSAIDVLWTSLFTLRNSAGVSYGVMSMIVVTWLVAAVVFASESAQSQESSIWLKMLFTILGVSLVLGLVYWFWHASSIASLAQTSATSMDEIIAQVNSYESLLTNFYIFALLLVFGLAFFLPAEYPVKATYASYAGATLGGIALVAAFFLSSYTNLRVVQADIAFKLAEPFTKGNQWPVAISIYKRANDLAPSEDYYYLFLGRAYLEYAKTLTDANEQENLITQAEADLLKAQKINPLNTDHTANLARLYSLWASFTNDATLRQQRAQKSSEYFSKAVTLSPKNARLWDEWSLVYLNILQQPDQAYPRLERALSIDPHYDWTYGLLGDYYTRSIRDISDADKKQEALQKARDYYQQALKLAGSTDAQMKYSYALALGGVETQLQQPEDAIAAYEQAIQLASNSSDNWRIEETIARLYAQQGDMANALVHAKNALSMAPDAQKDRLNNLISQMQGQP